MSSGFITEAEASEARRKRQEEWERVRKPEDPQERPEDPYDNRSLFDRLQEQKQKKDLEYEEAHKLKNMIKGLDDDEIDFLDLVDRSKLAADRKNELEEERELNDFRNRVATLQEQTLAEKLQVEKISNKPKTPNKIVSQQQKLLQGVVVKSKGIKRKDSEDHESNEEDHNNKTQKYNTVSENSPTKDSKVETVPDSALKCIGILPGLGSYTESSEENSSDSDIEVSPLRFDLVGRKIEEEVQKEIAKQEKKSN